MTAASYEVGSAFIQVVPSFDGVVTEIGAQAAKWGETAGQTFADTFRGTVNAELKNLESVKIDANTSDALAKIAEIRAEMESLRGEDIKVSMTDDEAQARLAELQAELFAIAAEHPTIKVNVDTGEASLALVAVTAESEAASVATKDLGGGSGAASSGLSAMSSNLGEAAGKIGVMTPLVVALGAALVPIGGLAAGAFAAMPAMIGGAVTGLGALYLGFSGVFGALSALMAPTTAPSSGSGSSAASSALSNATAERNAAYSVQQAEDALNNARISGAAAVTAAQQAAGQAMVTANQNVINSEQALVMASRAVTDAQYNEKQAQEAVMAARQAAQFQLENYTNQLADGAIAQQQAALNLTIAQQNYSSAMAPGTTATYDQQQQAQISLEQAQQAVTDLNTQNSQLATTAAQAFQAGVEGSSQVMSAEHNLQQAVQAVSDTLAAQVTAQQNVAAADMALANQVITNEQNVYNAQNANAQGVQNAQRALEQALANQKDAFERAAIPVGGAITSIRNYQTAYNALTPAGKEFVDFVKSDILPAFNKLKDAVQAVFLPEVTQGLKDLIPFFEAWQPLIIAAAQGIGQTFDELAKFAGTQPGLGQLNKILEAGNAFMQQMGGNLVTMLEAITGIGAQGTPILTVIGDGITSMVNAFAKWAEGGGFQKFMTWLRENGPSIVKDIEDLVIAGGKLLVALAPLGVVVDGIIGFFAKLVDVLINNWQQFGILFTVVGGAIALAGGPIIATIAGIGLLVAGIILLSTHWQEVWTNIKNWALDAWHYLDAQFISPLVDFFMRVIPNALDAFVGFFKALPDRVLHALGDFASKVWGSLVIGADWLDQHVWQPIENFFKGLPGDIGKAAEHMWDGVAVAFATVYDKIIGWWNDLSFTIPAIRVLGVTLFPGATFDTPNLPLIPIPQYHTGGVVQGTPGVEQLAVLMPGEIVTPAGVNIPSQLGGGSPITFAPVFNGVDLSNIQIVEKVVTDAFTQWTEELQPKRIAA